jgi:hypothetical protein
MHGDVEVKLQSFLSFGILRILMISFTPLPFYRRWKRLRYLLDRLLAVPLGLPGHWDWAPSQQYEQRGWFLSQQIMEVSHLLPQETIWTWRQFYKSTQVSTRSAAQAPRLLGQCSPGSPGFYPHPQLSSTCSPGLAIGFWPYPSPLLISHVVHTSSLPLPLYSWVFSTGGSVCSHLLTLVLRLQFFLPWRWRRSVPLKRRFTQVLQGAMSHRCLWKGKT